MTSQESLRRSDFIKPVDVVVSEEKLQEKAALALSYVTCIPFALSPPFSAAASPLPSPPSSLVAAVPGPVFLFQNTNRCNTVQYSRCGAADNTLLVYEGKLQCYLVAPCMHH